MNTTWLWVIVPLWLFSAVVGWIFPRVFERFTSLTACIVVLSAEVAVLLASHLPASLSVLNFLINFQIISFLFFIAGLAAFLHQYLLKKTRKAA